MEQYLVTKIMTIRPVKSAKQIIKIKDKTQTYFFFNNFCFQILINT